MSAQIGTSHPSSIYIGAIVGLIAISSLGIIMRILIVRRRMDALSRLNVNAGPMFYPQRLQSMPMQGYYTPAGPPPTSFPRSTPSTQTTWNIPAPAYSPPYPHPAAPHSVSSPAFSPQDTVNFPPRIVPAPSRNIRTPTQPRSPSATDNTTPANNPSSSPLPPPLPSEPSPLSQPPSLVDRMREVQNLMLNIHRLESDSASQDGRAKIQELQRRVTELSDTESLGQPVQRNITADANVIREPPPYALDGSG